MTKSDIDDIQVMTKSDVDDIQVITKSDVDDIQVMTSYSDFSDCDDQEKQMLYDDRIHKHDLRNITAASLSSYQE